MPKRRMGPPLRSFAADAYDCIMVRGPWTHRIQGCGATDPRPKAGSPLIVIPIAPSVPSCSKLSRYGLASSEHAASLARRPTLTAPARDDVSGPRVGTKKRALRSNKGTDEGQKICGSGEPLDKKSPIQENGGKGYVRRCGVSYRKLRVARDFDFVAGEFPRTSASNTSQTLGFSPHG